MNKYRADYLRLSQDDDGPGESNSIVGQRHIIQDYAGRIPELAGLPVKEFVDDGHSGLNFDRPDMKRLLEAVRRGEVACIIVKDFSRFGRKYLEVSKFIEQLFPYLGVRFIAVNDHYDSNDHKGTGAEIDVPLRNMINAMYSRDISKKIKGAKRTQASLGLYGSAFAPYGYVKDPKDTHRLAIDEPAAAAVRRIFGLAGEGKGPKQIADALNADGVPTPADYKKQRGSNIATNAMTPSLWRRHGVSMILSDERYMGTFIAGKREMGALGTGERIHKPKDEWIRIPGAIPAIVSPDTWDKALAFRKPTGRGKKKPDTGRALYKKVRCGHCGHMLCYRAEGSGSFYFCETPMYSDGYGCTREKYQEDAILGTVKAVVGSQMAIMLDLEKACQNWKKRAQRSAESAQAAAAGLEKEIGQLQTLKRQLYERFKKGALDKPAYCHERESVEASIGAKAEERDRLLARGDGQCGAIDAAESILALLKGFQTLAEPTAEMVNTLVGSVRVYSAERMEVKLSYIDEFEKAARALSDLRQNEKLAGQFDTA